MSPESRYTALRCALASMLADPTYPRALKSVPWVEARLRQGVALSQERVEQLSRLALRWAERQGGGVEAALRQALGEAESARLWPPKEKRPASRSERAAGPARRTDMDRSIAMRETDARPNTMPPQKGDPVWHQILTTHETPPYTTPASKWTRAVQWVEQGRVRPAPDAPATWDVQGSKGTVYRVTEAGCPCDHSTKGGTKWCYHLVAAHLYAHWETACMDQPELLPPPRSVEARLATAPEAPTADGEPDPAALAAAKHEIVVLVNKLGFTPRTREDFTTLIAAQTGLALEPPLFGAIITRLQAIVQAREEALAPLKTLRQYMITIQGKNYVTYQGLLTYAHERGLQELRATWILNEPELSLAHAVAVFPFGTFEESGDASPSTVSKGIAPSFRRMALTRAKARALRDALAIGEVAAEELE